MEEATTMMSTNESSTMLLVVGAFIGAALNPFADHLLAKLFRTKSGDSHSVKQGLLLLATANALWLIGNNLILANPPVGSFIKLAFYVSSLFLLFGAFEQLTKAKEVSLSELKNSTIGFLILGNLFWVCGEVWEPIEYILAIDSTTYLIGKYIFLVLSIALFSWGALSWFVQSFKETA